MAQQQQQQQYSYGYGYGYAPGTVGYVVQMPTYGVAATTPVAARPPAAQQQQTYQATPAVYTPQKSTAAPAQQQTAVGYYSNQSGGGGGTTSSYASPVAQQTSNFYGYQYRGTPQQSPGQQQQQQQQTPPQQQTGYPSTSYYQQPHTTPTASAVKATPPATPPTSHQGVGYGSSPSVAALPSVAYPSNFSSPYYSPAVTPNRYGFNTGVKTTAQTGVKSDYSTPPYTPSSASYPSTASYNAAQEKVIANYIAQKTGGGGGGGGGKFQNRRSYNPNNQAVYFCEVCKISCASSMTYRTHLEGKAHKKNLSKQQASSSIGGGGEGGGEKATDSSDKPHYCLLCEIQCTSNDSYEAHIRGARHTKVLNLFRKLGKTIPNIKLPEGTEITNTISGKKVAVSAPRINFVGGQQLTSTGAADKGSGPQSLYPPGPGGVMAMTTEGEAEGGGGEGEGTLEDIADVEPVGEQFVVSVASDPKFPHATYKCTMCDCYFNDDWAKKAHAKGRRHRLNYKKLYQHDLYVEPSKSNRRKNERQREQQGGGGGRGGRGRGRGGGGGGSGRGGGGGQQFDAEALRRLEAQELSKLHSGVPNTLASEVEGEVYTEGVLPHPPHPPPPPPPPPPHYEPEPPTHLYPSHPRNPRDDRLVMNKHGSICPVDSEVKAVEQAVTDVEGALKSISDDILDENCKLMSEEQGKEVARDEKHRRLRGVMRVGAFARSLMLRGECTVDLVLMCTGRPTSAMFHDIARRAPEKFEELSSEVVYNVSPEVGRAAILVIAQVEDHRVQVTLTLTSIDMREEPSHEQTLADQEAGVLHRPSCLAALAALRHTKWFQLVAQGLPSCSILMRVLKDICRRVPAWGVLNSWILELLVQKCLMSANPDYTRPGDVFRRVMECVASGIFLPGGSGLQDPCEKGVVDASSPLSAQERVNITLSAQHALRLIAFGKAHLVLGVDPIPPPGAKREPAAGEKAEEGGEKKVAETTATEPEAKRARLVSEETQQE